jgi:CMP-N,N'-diacetyllegionaminic acid synthase
MPSAVAFIPARHGSKRVPGKNIRRLNGHPMLAYSIAPAIESGLFESVIVSTDSEEIAAVARHYGAEVPFLRPPAFAGDLSPDIEWLEHALTELRRQGRTWDCFSLLRPTSPFRRANTIQRAWARFTAQEGVD